MSLDTVRLLEHVHGHLGWLAVAVLVHPAIVLRDQRRRAHLAVGLSGALATLAAGLGLWLYVAYRARLKRAIFIEAPAIGLLFERKEHLAFGAIALCWAGCAAYVAAERVDLPLRMLFRKTAYRAFVAAAALALCVAVLGTVVAVFASF